MLQIFLGLFVHTNIHQKTSRNIQTNSLHNEKKYIHTYIHKSFIKKMTERINLTIKDKVGQSTW